MPTAADATELVLTLARAAPGEVILLAAGDWGEVEIRDARFAAPVILRSADPAAPARFRRLVVRSARNLALEDIEIDHRLAPGEAQHAAGLRIDRSDDVAIRRAHVHGTADGDHTNDGTGLLALDCRNIAIEGARFHDLKIGASVGRTTGVVVRANEFRDLRSDGINVANASDVLIEGNRMTRFRTAQHRGDHPDFIQLWNDGQAGAMARIVVRANTLIQGDGDPVQGIFVEGIVRRDPRDAVWDIGSDRGTATAAPMRDVVIEGNTVLTGAAQGIWVFDADDVTLAGNTVAAPAGARLTPTIRNERRAR